MTARFSSSSLPAKQTIVVERLRELILLNLPDCHERLAYGVPHFYLNSRICFIWPTACPGSGVTEDGVLLGFWKGHLIKHRSELFRGQSNRIVRFVVFEKEDEINESDIKYWLGEARSLDRLKDLKGNANKMLNSR